MYEENGRGDDDDDASRALAIRFGGRDEAPEGQPNCFRLFAIKSIPSNYGFVKELSPRKNANRERERARESDACIDAT